MASRGASATSGEPSGPTTRQVLSEGTVLPAHPLALDAQRRLDERRQRALSRYYLAAGAGGLAVGVHTTQFQIHDPQVGLLEPVWALAAEEMDRADAGRERPLVRVAGLCGTTQQASREAELARRLGYEFGLLNLSAMSAASEDELVDHCRAVSQTITLFGFYLQPSVGGMTLPYSFWRRFAEIDNVAAAKIAAFNRYQTIDVVRAVAESGREDIALYTGNDDNIVADLLTPYVFRVGEHTVERRMVGGLLGHWAVWTSRACRLLEECHKVATSGSEVSSHLLQRGIETTDANAALFDVANGFRGCIAGIHEVLRQQGLLVGTWCLDEQETLSPGQAEQLDRVRTAYPHLTDDAFVSEHLAEWLSG